MSSSAKPLAPCVPVDDEYLVGLDPSKPQLKRERILLLADGSISLPRMFAHQFFRFCCEGQEFREVPFDHVPASIRAKLRGVDRRDRPCSMNLMKIRLDPRAWARFGQRKSLRSPISVGTSLPRKTRKKKPPRNLSKEGIEVKSSPTVIRDLSCFRCKHFDLESPDYVGAAFARGIPKLIMRLKNDHTIPYPGDNVIEFKRWVPYPLTTERLSGQRSVQDGCLARLHGERG